MTVNFGLTHYVECVDDIPPGSDFYGCNSYDLGYALTHPDRDHHHPNMSCE